MYLLWRDFARRISRMADTVSFASRKPGMLPSHLGDYKAARAQTSAMLANATAVSDRVNAQFLLGETCLREGIHGKRDDPLVAADGAFQAALHLQPNSADCLYADGEALAYLKRDEDAKERFRQFLRVVGPSGLDYARAVRFVERPELARAKMAPNFGLKTLDGRTLTLESLTGKVVLIDFWATWCVPCREAPPTSGRSPRNLTASLW
jgi:tetratricopeptide (TPR) repeat protein